MAMEQTSIFLKEMGQRVVARRKQLHLTQEQLAERMDVTPQMISSTELGKKAIRPENLVKLSQALSVSADYLLTGATAEADLLRLSGELRQLTSRELQLVEQIILASLALSRGGEPE